MLLHQLKQVGLKQCSWQKGDPREVATCAREPWDLMICDLWLGGEDLLSCLESWKDSETRAPLWLLSGQESQVLQSIADLLSRQGWPVVAATSKPVDEQGIKRVLLFHYLSQTLRSQTRFIQSGGSATGMVMRRGAIF